MADAANFAEQLNLLRQSYRAALPAKLIEIEKTWQGLQTAWNAEALDSLHRQVHNLSGSGAAYGFTRVSEAARPLEILIQSIGEAQSAATAPQQEKFAVLFATLQQAASEPDSVSPDSAPARNAATPDNGVAQANLTKLEVDGAGVQTPAAQMPAVPANDNQTSNALIFLISDDTVLAHELELQVSYFSYRVHTFTQLSDLEGAASETPPAAILVDMLTTGDEPIDMERVAQLKQGILATVPLVFISSHEDISHRLQAVRAGGDAYFTKPLDTGELIDKLDSLTASHTPEPYHILIVEDDSTLARYYTLNLQAAGMIASAITDPLQVLHALSEFRPDLILMDVYMPACNGLELSTVIRQQEDFVSIPIVFLSAETDLSKQMAAMSRGGDDFLTKPIKPAHLVASVASRAHRSRVLRSLMVR
ncbi:MAG: response regulator, partial [Abitibacteriaceae bacterium]|nr:response regulator [Abditibacteriaceae bacterium]